MAKSPSKSEITVLLSSPYFSFRHDNSSLIIAEILDESDKIRLLKELEDWQYGNYIMVEKYIKGREFT